MGRPKNPVDTYDDELWKSLHYLADLWNENPECRKIIVQDYYSEMKYMMKHMMLFHLIIMILLMPVKNTGRLPIIEENTIRLIELL